MKARLGCRCDCCVLWYRTRESERRVCVCRVVGVGFIRWIDIAVRMDSFDSRYLENLLSLDFLNIRFIMQKNVACKLIKKLAL